MRLDTYTSFFTPTVISQTNGMGKRAKKNSDNAPSDHVAAKRSKSNEASGMPTSSPWTIEDNARTWQLIAELGNMENYKVE